MNGSEDGADAEGVVTILDHFKPYPVSFFAPPRRSPRGLCAVISSVSGVAGGFRLTVLRLSVECWHLLDFVAYCCFRMRIIECFCGL
ncbi:MAG: hypothetical protein ACR2O7_17715 [Parasphingorhabdus sp.]